MPHLDVADALAGPDFAPTGPVRVTWEGGRLTALAPLPAAPAGPRRLLLPAPVNAHDHARPLSPTSFGAGGKPLETWLLRLAAAPAVDPWLAAAAALARAALGGVAGAMVHYVRPMGGMSLTDEAAQVARAAEAVGLRIGLAMGMRDRNPLVYGAQDAVLARIGAADAGARALLDRTVLAPPRDPAAQIAAVEEIAQAVRSDLVDVQFGPMGVQWCSPALLEGIAEASARTGMRVHMHLLETRYQRDWAERAFPGGGMVPWLKSIGLLTPRLTVAHAVWASPDDLAVLAECGVRVSVNTSSNLNLKSGIAPVPGMLAAGVPVAMGVDGCAFDEDDDALRELRLFKALHAGWGFDEILTPTRALHAACVTGRGALGAPAGGVLEPGAPADLLALDLDALDRDAIMPVDPRELLFARAAAPHLSTLIVAGREVVADGRLTGLDAAEIHDRLRAAYREALPATEAFRAAWPAIEPAVAAHYRDALGCC